MINFLSQNARNTISYFLKRSSKMTFIGIQDIFHSTHYSYTHTHIQPSNLTVTYVSSKYFTCIPVSIRFSTHNYMAFQMAMF